MLSRINHIIILSFSLALISFAACGESKDVKYGKLIQEADKHIADNQNEYARIKLLSALDLKPKDAETYFKLAEVLMKTGDIGGALENYKSAINYDPSHKLARIRLASLFLLGKQTEFAEEHVRKVLENYPEDQEALVLDANLRALRGEKEEARKILSSILAKNEKFVPAVASLAQIELNEGKFPEAEESLRKALAIDPDNGPMKLALADLFAKQGRLDESQELMEKLVSSFPDQKGLKFLFGEFLMQRGFGDKAIDQYKETIKIDPLSHVARDRLYDMYLSRGLPAMAKALTAELEKSNPKDSGVSYFKGRDYELEQRDEKALEMFLKTIQGLNNFSPAFRRAGLIEMRLGRVTEGYEHLNQAVTLNDKDVAAHLAMARYHFQRNQLDQAKQHVAAILRVYPRQLGATELSADIALVEGDLASARKVYEFLVQIFPKRYYGFFKMGVLAQEEGKDAEAIEWYRKTLAFDQSVMAPARRFAELIVKYQGVDAAINEVTTLLNASKNSKAEYNFALASLLLTKDVKGNFDRAKNLFQEAVNIKQDFFEAYVALASLDAVSGNLAGAIKNYETILVSRPDHVPTLMLLALTQDQSGKKDEAEKNYRKIIEYSPRFGPAANNLAWLIAQREGANLEEALQLAQIAKEALPNESSVTDTLGWIYFRKGSNSVALSVLEEAVDLERKKSKNSPVNPEILYHLAVVKEASGDKAGAKLLLEEAASLVGGKGPLAAPISELLSKLS